MTCANCGHDAFHADTEPRVCSILDCNCSHFIEATIESQIMPGYQKYLNGIETTKDQVKWVLENLKFTRNFRNEMFVDFFRSKVRKADPETIRRSKQYLVARNHDRYGAFNPTLLEEKAYKQLAIEEWVTQT